MSKLSKDRGHLSGVVQELSLSQRWEESNAAMPAAFDLQVQANKLMEKANAEAAAIMLPVQTLMKEATEKWKVFIDERMALMAEISGEDIEVPGSWVAESDPIEIQPN